MSLPLPSIYCNTCGYPLSFVRWHDGFLFYTGHCNACRADRAIAFPEQIRASGSPPPKLDAVAASQEPRFSDSPDEAAA